MAIARLALRLRRKRRRRAGEVERAGAVAHHDAHRDRRAVVEAVGEARTRRRRGGAAPRASSPRRRAGCGACRPPPSRARRSLRARAGGARRAGWRRSARSRRRGSRPASATDTALRPGAPQLVEPRPAGLDHLPGAQHHALLFERARVGRHAAGADAADLGVMRAVGGEEERLRSASRLAGRVHRRVAACGASAAKTGVTSVMSGRCEPPRNGSLVSTTSPGPRSGTSRRTQRTVSLIAPRCTGMCGAFATSDPEPSNTAHEKSSRSFTLTESAVRRSMAPISSAMAAKWWLKSSSSIGLGCATPSAAVWRCASARFAQLARRRAPSSSSNSSPRAVRRARHPGSTTVVPVASTTIAGPSNRSPGSSRSRS